MRGAMLFKGRVEVRRVVAVEELRREMVKLVEVGEEEGDQGMPR